ncbi:S9 family peptidase [Pseudoxanthomonas daejeonensis]|uniref:Peptidase S9 family protein n=1 Tax=Pseudoxanthomonas daejeonensis TaxID=266062 RepID=A0ABQ6ZBT8_9GAMM|nr:S9 family peptidase [Pseudoxanthomonas daejeonensis]KAF1697512.1 peptidase S9 family protein [Pseudoxanthomonas daejeonensis]
MKPLRVLALVAAIASASLSPAFAKEALKAEDIYALSMVTDPVVAPDGRRVLFTRATFDRAKDRRTGELWLAHLDQQGTVVDKRLLVGRDMAPRGAAFSPDGRRLAYIANSIDKPQIFVMVLADGVGQPLTTGDLDPGSLRWSPDGTRIAFIGREAAKPASIPGMPEKPEGSDAAADAKIITDLFWRADGAGEVKPGARHPYVVDVANATVTRLTQGDTHQVDDEGVAWMADGRHVVGSYTADPINGPLETDLYLYDAAGKAPKKRLTSRAGREFAPEVSPDGRRLAFLGSEASTGFYDMPRLWTTTPAPGAPVQALAADLDRPVAGIAWREDGAAIHALYNDQGVQRIATIDAATGERTPVVPVVGGTRLYLPSSGGQFSAAHGTFAYTSAFTDRPAGLGVSRGNGESGAIDFNRAWADSRTPARIESLTVASRADGLPVQGWIAFPPDFKPGKRYPLILDIHGGPNTDYGPFFSITHGLYAAAGYIVVFANPRGSIGYGDRFANAITNAYPGQDHDDLMSLLDEVARRPYADAKNLFIGGGSGGGVLTLWAIGKEPDKFRAAVALRPVVDWTDQATTADFSSFFMKHWMGATPWDKPDLYFQRSPFSLAVQVKTPTMLITGEQDFRTPISQTEQMFGALKMRGVEVEMIRLPGAGHGMGRPSQWLQSVLAPIDFFERHKAE